MDFNTTNLLEGLTISEKKDIVNRITQFRVEILQISQRKFAKHAQISQAFLSMLESGQRDICSDVLGQIAAAFQINLEWLIFGIGEPSGFIPAEELPAELTDLLEHRTVVLQELEKAYSLDSTEADFIGWYLSLSKKDRSRYAKAVTTLSELHKH